MKKVIILHGVCDKHEYFEMDFPSPSNAHWLPWLQQKFLRSGVLCQTLEMPKPYKPVYREWAETFSAIKLDTNTSVVAHSAGCGFILKWLSLNPSLQVDRLIFVAPWLDLARSQGDFLECALPENLEARTHDFHVLYSSDDPVVGVSETKDMILRTYKSAELHSYSDKGHFCLSNLRGPIFPELWDICGSNLP